MKKIMISIGLCLVGFVTVAQNVDEVNNAAYVNKRGVYLLPQAGDFALGINASPLLGYLGSFFSNSGNEAPKLSSQTFYGKYFLEDNRAIRAKLKLDLSNAVYKGFDNTTESDIQRESKSSVGLGIGYEFRRGSGRVQGFYGGEFLLGYGGKKDKYEYDEKMSEGDPDRIVKLKHGKRFSFGPGAFAGVEYFFAPQLSLGCEVGLGLIFSATGQSQTITETWDSDNDRSENQTEKSKTNDWNLKIKTDTGGSIFGDNATYSFVSIFLMFHF